MNLMAFTIQNKTILVVLTIIFVISAYNTNALDNDEMEVLTDLYETWPLLKGLYGWKATVSEACDGTAWQGLTCDSEKHVTALTFNNVNRLPIVGKFPSNIGKLSYLKKISLSGNSISGSIPSSISSLNSIQEINLSRNKMTGSIPYSIGTLTSLTYINLASNEFNGIIPDSFSNLSQLKTLDISSNDLFLCNSNMTSLPASLTTCKMNLQSRASCGLTCNQVLSPCIHDSIEDAPSYHLICPNPSTCSTLRPSNSFYCYDSVWVAPNGVADETLILYGKTQVLFDANNVSLTFASMKAFLSVSNCITLNGPIRVRLNEAESKMIEQGEESEITLKLIQSKYLNCPNYEPGYLTQIRLKMAFDEDCLSIGSFPAGNHGAVDLRISVDRSRCKQKNWWVPVVAVFVSLILVAIAGVAFYFYWKRRVAARFDDYDQL